MTKPIRVLIACDEPPIIAGIRAVLESAGGIEVVGQAPDGAAAVEMAVRRHVDVALVDIKMPVLDGPAAVERLRVATPTVSVVVLTGPKDEPQVLRALRKRAAGLVLKDCVPDELIRAVRAAAAGEAYLSQAVACLVLGTSAPQEDG